MTLRRLLAALPAVLFGAALLGGCDGFVNDVDPPIDRVPDGALNDPEQLPFLTTGVRETFNPMHSFGVVLAGGLSDELFYGGPRAFQVSYAWIDEGQPRITNASGRALYGIATQLRFLADDLLRRIRDDIDFAAATESDAARYAEYRRAAEFAGHFYGGVARAYLATYFGLTEREGGSPLDNGPFIPAAELYVDALARLALALGVARDDYEQRVVHSVMARVHLYRGDLAAARAAAQNGLVEGDPPFQAHHSSESINWVWGRAGFLQTQYAVAEAYVAYADPRVPVEEYAPGFYRQALYPSDASPVTFVSWQENNLMLAEAALLLDSDEAQALALANANRAAVGLAPLAGLDLDGLLAERAKELFCEGRRVVDQRRFERWHLGDDTWRYLPVPQSERDANPHL